MKSDETSIKLENMEVFLVRGWKITGNDASQGTSSPSNIRVGLSVLDLLAPLPSFYLTFETWFTNNIGQYKPLRSR